MQTRDAEQNKLHLRNSEACNHGRRALDAADWMPAGGCAFAMVSKSSASWGCTNSSANNSQIHTQANPLQLTERLSRRSLHVPQRALVKILKLSVYRLVLTTSTSEPPKATHLYISYQGSKAPGTPVGAGAGLLPVAVAITAAAAGTGRAGREGMPLTAVAAGAAGAGAVYGPRTQSQPRSSTSSRGA